MHDCMVDLDTFRETLKVYRLPLLLCANKEYDLLAFINARRSLQNDMSSYEVKYHKKNAKPNVCVVDQTNMLLSEDQRTRGVCPYEGCGIEISSKRHMAVHVQIHIDRQEKLDNGYVCNTRGKFYLPS